MTRAHFDKAYEYTCLVQSMCTYDMKDAAGKEFLTVQSTRALIQLIMTAYNRA